MIRFDKVTVDIPVHRPDRGRSMARHVVGRLVGGSLRSRSRSRTIIRALDDVTFTILAGERYGIIGHNGAGKTTLLKTIAGIYPISSGTMAVYGELRTFFNLSAGLDPSRSGLINVKNLALFYTLDARVIDELTPRIVEFSELGDFIDMPVSSYSTGMLARLIVSVALSFEGDVLVMDEMLGAGDAWFMQKVNVRVHEVLTNSRILVFATHATELVRKLCDKVIWLEQGRIRMIGKVNETIDEFHRAVASADATRR